MIRRKCLREFGGELGEAAMVINGKNSSVPSIIYRYLMYFGIALCIYLCLGIFCFERILLQRYSFFYQNKKMAQRNTSFLFL